MRKIAHNMMGALGIKRAYNPFFWHFYHHI